MKPVCLLFIFLALFLISCDVKEYNKELNPVDQLPVLKLGNTYLSADNYAATGSEMVIPFRKQNLRKIILLPIPTSTNYWDMWGRGLHRDTESMMRCGMYKGHGLYVRLIKD